MRQNLVPFKIQIGILKRTHLKHMHYNALPQTTYSPIIRSPVNQRTVIEKKHFRHHNHCSFICRATDNWKGRCLWLPYALKVSRYWVLCRPSGGGPRLDRWARIQSGQVNFGVFSTSRFVPSALSSDFFTTMYFSPTLLRFSLTFSYF